MMRAPIRSEHAGNLLVLSLIGGGLIAILLSIIAGLFLGHSSHQLPNWAENVLVSIATAAALKLGDVTAALVALATGRQIEGLGKQISGYGPPVTVPGPPADTAKETLDLTGAELPPRPGGERL
jgi:hypothetical protein